MTDPIKEAFFKVKEDITDISYQIKDLKDQIFSLNKEINTLKLQKIAQKDFSDRQTDTSTLRQITSTDTPIKTDTSTVPMEIQGLKPLNLPISTGNQGVSTDRQTDTSTDRQTQNNPNLSIESNIEEAKEILDSLDNIRKEIRLKVKKLTQQEMLVFSSIYQLEEQNHPPNYKELAQKTKLSESSIRDYIQRIITKGIPLNKEKIDNKKVILSISPNFRKLASLPTLIKLREL